MTKIKHILLQLSCAILVMHSLVPHDHHEELKVDNETLDCTEVHCFIDLIKIAFRSDIGEGHLDHFLTSDRPDLLLKIGVDLFPSNASFTFVNQPNTLNDFPRIAIRKKTPHLSGSIDTQVPALRGPPIDC